MILKLSQTKFQDVLTTQTQWTYLHARPSAESHEVAPDEADVTGKN